MSPIARTGLGLAALVVVLSLFGARSAQPFAATQAADSLSFKLDPVHCMANFRVQHMGAGMFWGRFNDVTGTIETDETGKTAPKFNVQVQVESIDTGTDKLDRTLMGPNFFDAKEFTAITFTSTDAKSDDEGAWEVTGNLTMLGVTRAITARVELTGAKGSPVMKKIGYEATFSIKRSDFGMKWGVANGALGDTVRLVVGLEGDWTA